MGMSEPTLSLNDSAVMANELYRSMRKGGFGRWESLWLTAVLLKGVPLPGWFADRLNNMDDE